MLFVCSISGVKLPQYITKLLKLAGYGHLQSLSRLTNNDLIQELEQYATNYLDSSDLNVKEQEERFLFNQNTKKFTILPGHKHLIIHAAETVNKLMQRAQEKHAQRELQELEEDDNHLEDNDMSAEDENKAALEIEGPMHFLAGLHNSSSNSSKGTNKKRESNKQIASQAAIPTLEEEQQSLTDYITLWIQRKAAAGELEALILDVDYRIKIIRPRNSGSQPFRPDVYSFVCLRCKTTIKAFKRPNGTAWNTTNVK